MTSTLNTNHQHSFRYHFLHFLCTVPTPTNTQEHKESKTKEEKNYFSHILNLLALLNL